MRLVTRAEFRSVICGGSIVTGSARSPMTIASFGGAAEAAVTRPSATRVAGATRRGGRRGPPRMGADFYTAQRLGRDIGLDQLCPQHQRVLPPPVVRLH